MPWTRRTTRTLVNHGRPPRPIDSAKLRPLPWAPWAGVRGPSGPPAEPKPMPLDGELDLHPFSPKEVRALVLETIEQHRAAGILALRIVHGKGIGNLRRTVHALLDRHPAVAGYRLGGHGAGSWGATLVDLHPLPDGDADDEAVTP
ncbi:MAG: Smr/MutS family protein [Myxococcales bacterium]|nr:Smr/MutS family protein [Myxococcales bacterium]